MKGLIYWMVFQMLIGIWLFISPFALGFKEMTAAALNNMLLGAVVLSLGLGIFLYETSEEEAFSGMRSGLHVSSTLRRL
jgi:hypothetical protein